MVSCSSLAGRLHGWWLREGIIGTRFKTRNNLNVFSQAAALADSREYVDKAAEKLRLSGRCDIIRATYDRPHYKKFLGKSSERGALHYATIQ